MTIATSGDGSVPDSTGQGVCNPPHAANETSSVLTRFQLVSNCHELMEIEQFIDKSVTLKLRATDGKMYDTIVLNMKSVMEICRLSRAQQRQS